MLKSIQPKHCAFWTQNALDIYAYGKMASDSYLNFE